MLNDLLISMIQKENFIKEAQNTKTLWVKKIRFKGFWMFDNGNDAWLRYKGKDGEWAVSYHGTAKENIEGIMIEEY